MMTVRGLHLEGKKEEREDKTWQQGQGIEGGRRSTVTREQYGLQAEKKKGKSLHRLWSLKDHLRSRRADSDT